MFGAGGFSRLNNFGTGIIISKDGYMLTVASQLLDTSDLVVHLYDGQRLKAAGRRRRTGTRRGASSRFAVEGKKTRRADWASTSPYFDFAEAAKRPHAGRATGCSALSNTFEIALRDEPLSVQRGVVIGVHEAGRPARRVRVPVHRRRVRRGHDHEQPRRGRRCAHRPQGRTCSASSAARSRTA